MILERIYLLAMKILTWYTYLNDIENIIILKYPYLTSIKDGEILIAYTQMG